MSLNSMPLKGMGMALSLITLLSPWFTLEASANAAKRSGAPEAEIAQTPPTPTPSPSPAPSPSPTPAPSPSLAPSPTPAPSPAPAPSPSPTPAPAPQSAPQAAPDARAVDTPLFERSSFVSACRKTNRTVEVFADVALSPVNRVGTLGPNTQITLTGVLGTGRAQILRRDTPTSPITIVGWVNAAFLTTCDVPVQFDARYQINANGLSVRTSPSVNAGYRGALPAGAIVCATTNPPREQTSPNTSPNFGRIWTEIVFQGSPGWISRTGQNGSGANATRISDAPCP